MTELDWPPPPPPDMTALERPPRKCRRHDWATNTTYDREGFPERTWVQCGRCLAIRDETRARRGKQSRNYGNRAELAVARTYGGEKIGMAGGPVDVRGKDWNTQVKTHRRPPPREWISAFNAMAANRERLPRLLVRFVMGPGVAPDDYMVVPAKAWLDWFGRDEVVEEDSTT